MNSLLERLEGKVVKVYCYADDLLVLSSNIRYLKSAISVIETWCSEMDMVLNKKKCGVLFYNKSRKALSKWEER